MTGDLTIEILKQIRDELVTVGNRIDAVRTKLGARIDETNLRVSAMETTLLDLAEQQRFVVRHLQALTARDRMLENDVDELRARVDKIEKHIAG